MNRISFYIILLFTLSACEYDIDVDIPSEKKLVVLSNFNTIERLAITVSTNEIIDNNSDSSIYPENATVELSDSKNNNETLKFEKSLGSNGVYLSEIIPTVDTEYSVKVSYKDYKDAEAYATIPFPLEIDSKTFIGKTILEPDEDEEFDLNTNSIEFELGFNPDSLKNKFFHLNIYKNLYFTDIDYSSHDTTLIKYGDELLRSENESIAVVRMFHEDGILFSGNDLQFTYGLIRTETSYFIFNDEYESPIIFEIRNVSEDYYKFHKTLAEQDVLGFRQNILNNQAIFVHNNINNGIGNFSGYSVIIDSIEIQ